MQAMGSTLQTQAQGVVALSIGFARTDDRWFVQKYCHGDDSYGKGHDQGHTVCDWRFASARKRGAGPPYRLANSLANILGPIFYEICLPAERAIAMGVAECELSGDE